MGIVTRNMSPRRLTLRHPSGRVLVLAAIFLCALVISFRLEAVDLSARVLETSHVGENSGLEQHPLQENQRASDQHNVDDESEEESSENEAEQQPSKHAPQQQISMNCTLDPEYLQQLGERYKLGEKFEYLKRYVMFSRQPIKRESVTRINQRFLPPKSKFFAINKAHKHETCPEPLYVPVTNSPFPATANASDFMFGVSTTFERFNDARTSPVREWTYWLTDGKGNSNGGTLVLFLLKATDEQLESVAATLKDAGIHADVYHSDASLEMAVRYLSLVPALYNHPERKNKKWLVTCDDDTFFPSMHALVERFERFNSSRMMYIGTLSEDVNALDRHGSQAFGGAGVFLSVPMAEKITEVYESCRTEEKIHEANSGWGPQGDILLRKCIYENTEVRLTVVWDLWQLDILGDPSGFYESGIKPLSLHHYRGGWHIAHPWHYTKIAHICGEDCTLQRFQTDDDFVISTSFSVAHYPQGITFDLEQMERTFGAAPEDKGWNLDFKFGPQRPSLLKTGRKISWDLQESNIIGDGAAVRQIYVRRKNDWRWVDEDGEPMSGLDGIIELIWMADTRHSSGSKS